MTAIDAYEQDENDEDTSIVLPRTNSVRGPLHLRNDLQLSSESTTEILPEAYHRFEIETGSKFSKRTADLLKEFHTGTEKPAKEVDTSYLHSSMS